MSSCASDIWCRAAFVLGTVAVVAAPALGGCSLRDLGDLTSGDGGTPDAPIPCAKDCLGGACVDGKCQPVTLVSGRNSPWGIAVDTTRGDVYWSEPGPIGVVGSAFKLVPGGPAVASPYIVSDVGPAWLFAFSGKLYWTGLKGTAAVGRCTIPGAGCTYHPNRSTQPPGSIVASGLGSIDFVNNPDRVVADASGIYWTNTGTSKVSRDGSVVVCRATGCGSPPPQILTEFQSRPRGIAIDDTYVYWVNQGPGPDLTEGAVLRIPKVGGTAETLASGLQAAAYIAADANNVYWTVGASGMIMVWPKPSGPAQVFADGQGGAWDIAVDDSGVYWTTYGPSGTVAMCPTTGCGAGVTILAPPQNGPFGIALDATAVYWTVNDPTAGAVMKVAKP